MLRRVEKIGLTWESLAGHADRRDFPSTDDAANQLLIHVQSSSDFSTLVFNSIRHSRVETQLYSYAMRFAHPNKRRGLQPDRDVLHDCPSL